MEANYRNRLLERGVLTVVARRGICGLAVNRCLAKTEHCMRWRGGHHRQSAWERQYPVMKAITSCVARRVV